MTFRGFALVSLQNTEHKTVSGFVRFALQPFKLGRRFYCLQFCHVYIIAENRKRNENVVLILSNKEQPLQLKKTRPRISRLLSGVGSSE